MGSDPGGNFWYYGNIQKSNSTSFEQAKKTDLLHKIKRKTKNQAIIAAIEAGEKNIDYVSINQLTEYYLVDTGNPYPDMNPVLKKYREEQFKSAITSAVFWTVMGFCTKGLGWIKAGESISSAVGIAINLVGGASGVLQQLIPI